MVAAIFLLGKSSLQFPHPFVFYAPFFESPKILCLVPVLVPVVPRPVGQDNEQEVRKEAVRVIEACLNLLGISAPWQGETAG